MDGNTQRFSDILKDYVSNKKKINPNISENQIAKNLGVSSTTFHRMLNYSTYPSVKNLIQLCKSVPKLKSLVTEEMLEVTRESKTGKWIGEDLENLLSKKHLFIVYALAISSNGVTDDEILYCLGHEGLKALDVLIKRKFVIKKEEDNRYKALDMDNGIVLSFDLLKKHVQLLASAYRPDNVANNYIYYKTETLNKKGIKELYEIHKQAHRKVQALMEKEAYKGDIPTFSVGFFDRFFIKNSKEQSGRENVN